MTSTPYTKTRESQLTAAGFSPQRIAREESARRKALPYLICTAQCTRVMKGSSFHEAKADYDELFIAQGGRCFACGAARSQDQMRAVTVNYKP